MGIAPSGKRTEIIYPSRGCVADTWSRLSETRNPVSERPVHVKRVHHFPSACLKSDRGPAHRKFLVEIAAVDRYADASGPIGFAESFNPEPTATAVGRLASPSSPANGYPTPG